VSYYDSAVAIFELDDQGNYQFMQAIRDCLPYDEVFSDNESVKIKINLSF
jgi:hypothetical protein